MFNKRGIFSQSRKLKKIIDSNGWNLYDVSNPPEGRAYSWGELNKMSPAEEFELNHQYMFIPKPEKGQTLRDAYSITKGLGPSLTIEDPKDKRWLSIEIWPKRNQALFSTALFTRLFFHPECAFVTIPKTYYWPNPDFVAIRYEKLVDTFEKYFRIIRPEELDLPTPVPMPFIN